MILRNAIHRSEQLRRCQSGSVAVEFAFVFPLLVFVLGAICETGLFLLYQSELQHAADRAARQIRVGNVGPVDEDATQNQLDLPAFKALVCRELVVADCLTRIHVDVQRSPTATFAALSPLVPSPESVGPAAAGASYGEVFEPGAPGETGSLIVTYDWDFTFPGIAPIFGNVQGGTARRLYGISIYRNEM